MAVRHNLAVALPVAHTFHTKRHTHTSMRASELKQSHSRTSQNNQKYQRYCGTLLLSACILILLLKSEEKFSTLNKYFLCLTHWGGINQTHPHHVHPRFTTLFTLRIIAISHTAPHLVLNSLKGFQNVLLFKKRN